MKSSIISHELLDTLSLYKNVKNLVLIDYTVLATYALQAGNTFNAQLGFTLNKTDYNKIILYYAIEILFACYERYKREQAITLLLVQDTGLSLDKEVFLIFKRIFRLFEIKFAIPTLSTNLSFEEIILLLSGNSPEYDEAITTRFDLTENFNKITKYFKTNGFTALTKKYDGICNAFNFLTLNNYHES